MSRRRLLLTAASLFALAAEAAPPTTSKTQLEASAGLSNKTVYETFYLYGAPGSNEGSFETPSGLPDAQGWVGVDLTDHPDYWQVSTFNADNLNNHGAGNLAMWCGRTAAQEPLWPGAPGYGNNWNESLVWLGTAPNPTADTELTLEFWYNLHTEPGFDFFHVEWNSGGTWVELFQRDGNNVPYDPPGGYFQQTWTVPSSAYTGIGADQIELRLRFSSDGAWSDQDGLFPGDGAVQADDIRVAFNGVDVSLADFEPAGSDGGWTPDYDIVGDFSKIFDGLTDLDPCITNSSPQFTFIDDGTSPNNAPGESTGGATNPMWNYGIPGGWIVNDNGGLRADGSKLENEVWSPVIEWDLPGTADDAASLKTWLAYDVYIHQPASIFSPVDGFRVRFSLDGGSSWEPWSWPSNNYRTSNDPKYLRRVEDLSDWIPAATTHLQVALRCAPQDTPAPFYDNVAIWKERSGPIIQVAADALLQDGWPANASIDASTLITRAVLDIPTSRVEHYSGLRFPLTVTILPADPNETLNLANLELVWILEKNPLFIDQIRNPPGAWTILGPSERGWVQIMGSVAAQVALDEDRYQFPLPDLDFLYPGDVLRYYLSAEDANGLVTTLPEDVSGFQANENFDRRFIVRGLPTITSESGDQPSILVVDYSEDDNVQNYPLALAQAGFHEGFEYDTFHPRFSTFLPDGSALGTDATPGQLVGYSRIIWLGRTQYLHEDDVSVLDAWRAKPGDHLTAIFFDDLQMYQLGTGEVDQLFNGLGVDRVDGDVSDEIDGQRNPKALPASSAFAMEFELNGLCPVQRKFDSIAPLTGATIGHGYEMLASPGNVYPNVPASVVWDRLDVEGDRLIDVTFPFELEAARTPSSKVSGGRTAASYLLEEVLSLLGDPGAGSPTAAPSLRPGIHALDAVPNPFNPRTTIRFELGSPGEVSLRIFDLRGRLVRELLREELPAGRHAREWNGVDDRGQSVASGVYMVQVEAAGFVELKKIALLK